MGILNFDKEKRHFKRICRALIRRGLKLDLEEIWQIHGPHFPQMPYQVYVGSAYTEADKNAKCVCSPEMISQELTYSYCPAHRQYVNVVIYPKAVYEIEDTSGWRNPDPENRIRIEDKF